MNREFTIRLAHLPRHIHPSEVLWEVYWKDKWETKHCSQQFSSRAKAIEVAESILDTPGSTIHEDQDGVEISWTYRVGV